MSSEVKAQYFCSGCGAMRQQGAKRCVSCGRLFDDESNASETIYALTHPQVKAPYKERGPVARFLDRIFSFHGIMWMISITMILIAVGSLAPYAIGIRSDAVVTDLEAINCRKDCQYIVTYRFVDNLGRTRTGTYHWSYSDYEFNPPKKGEPTVVKYIPFLSFIPAVSPRAWFPWGMPLLGLLGVLLAWMLKRHVL